MAQTLSIRCSDYRINYPIRTRLDKGRQNSIQSNQVQIHKQKTTIKINSVAPAKMKNTKRLYRQSTLLQQIASRRIKLMEAKRKAAKAAQ